MSGLIIPKNMPSIAERAVLRARLDGIKQNQDRLDNCLKHEFNDDLTKLVVGSRMKCAKCEGVIDAIGAYQYTLGYKACGGDPKDVMPNWDKQFNAEQSVVTGDGFKKDV